METVSIVSPGTPVPDAPPQPKVDVNITTDIHTQSMHSQLSPTMS